LLRRTTIRERRTADQKEAYRSTFALPGRHRLSNPNEFTPH